MFKGSIFIKKEKKKHCPLGRPWPKNICINFSDKYGNFVLNLKVLSLIIKKIEILPLPVPGTPLEKILFCFSLIYMYILVFKFGRPISNNKDIKCLPPPLETPLTRYIFFISLINIEYWYLCLTVLSVIIKKERKICPPP